MPVLRNVSLRHKILLLLMVPLLGLIYLAIDGTLDRSRTVGQMTAIRKISGLAIAASALVHEAQKERGMTVGFLDSSGKEFKAELQSQRSATDSKVAELRGFLKDFDGAAYGSQFAGVLGGALARLEQLEGMRRDVSGLSVSAGDAIGYYTALNAAFLDVIGHISNLAADGEVARTVTAYITFLRAKEAAGIERAMLMNAFARDRFEPGVFSRLSAVVSEQDALTKMFRSLASDSAKRYADEKMRGRAIEEAERMRKVGFERESTGRFRIDPGYWFRTQTEKIDILKEVENRLSEELASLAGRLEAGARSARLFFITLTVAIAGSSLGAAILVARRIARPLKETVAVLEELARGEGDLTRRIDVRTNDEIGALGRAFNSFLDRCHEVIAMASRISKGDFSVIVAPKSDRDELGRAFQEMTEYLREVAETASKVAEGDLAVHIFVRSEADMLGKATARMMEYLYEMAVAAERISEGDLELSLVQRSERDLFGQAFGRMVVELRSVAQVAGRISEGDLSANVVPRSERDLLGHALRRMVEQLRKILGEMALASTQVSGLACQILSSSVEQEKITLQQSGSVNETATTVVELSASQREVAQSAQVMNDRASSSEQQIGAGRRSVSQVVEGLEKMRSRSEVLSTQMGSLSGEAQAIGKIAVTIRAITEQINLLALNAAIEAARAGEQGRGFAVVAQEVRKLAERTSKAAEEIGGLIDGIQSATGAAVTVTEESRRSVEEGVQEAARAAEVFEAMSTGLSQIFESMRQVKEATAQQDHATGEIVIAMREVDDGMKASISGLQETATAAQDLNRVADQLKDLVEQFHAEARQ